MRCDRYEVLRVLPFVLSDGGVYNNREIYFTSTDAALVGHFRTVATVAFGYGGYVVKRSNGAYVVKIKGYDYFKCLAEVMPDILYKNDKGRAIRLPDELYSDKDLAKWFIKVYASCDGGVSVMLGRRGNITFYVRRVFITSKNPYLRRQIGDLLKALSFAPRDDGDKHIYLSRREDIVRYAEEIRFLEQVKVTKNSKRFRGMEKNQLLDLVVRSYGNPHLLDPFFPPSSFSHNAGLARAQRGLDTPVVPAVNDAG